MDELRPGLWTWTAPHPDWTPDQGGPEGWEREVRSYAHDAGPELVLFDPLAPPAAVEELAAGKSVVVLLTCEWHGRSSAALVERLGARIYVPPPERESMGFAVTVFRPGDTLPGGVVAKPAGYASEAVLWLEAHRALVAGDVLLGGEGGLHVQPDAWLAQGMTHDGLRDALRPLLELPLEAVLPTHGDPVVHGAREALARALAG